MSKLMLLIAAAALTLAGCDKAGDTNSAAPASAGNAVTTPAGTDWTAIVVATPEGGFRMGNPGAPVKLVEYASMTCSHCSDFSAEASAPLQKNYVKSGKVSYEFRNFVRDQIDVVASLLARCGGPQPFFKLTEQMFDDQGELFKRVEARSADLQAAEALPGQQTFVRVAEVAGLDKFVGMRGVPPAKAKACLTDKAELDKLVAINQDAANRYKIPGTPMFLINGEVIDAPPGTEPWAYLKPALDAAVR